MTEHRAKRKALNGGGTDRLKRNGEDGRPVGSLGWVMFQMAICVTGIYVCFGFWSIKQERIVTKPYKVVVEVSGDSDIGRGGTNREVFNKASNGTVVKEAKLSTVFVIGLAQVVAAVVFSSVLLAVEKLYMRITHSQATVTPHAKKASGGSVRHVNPAGSVSLSSVTSHTVLMGFTNAFASMLGFAAMRRLPYPVVLATKMSKMVPVILVGFFWHGTRYSLNKCLACALITGGSFCFYFFGEADESPHKSKPHGGGADANWLGFVLLFFNLLADGFTNSTQDKLVKTHNWTGNKLMFFANIATAAWLSLLLLLLECLHPFADMYLSIPRPLPITTLPAIYPYIERADTAIRWFLTDLAPLQDFSRTMHFFQQFPEALHDVIVMSLLNAAGQMFIFRTISLFGSLTVTAMTLLRKSASVLLSIVVHGHTVAPGQWISLLVVFAGAVWEGLIHTYGGRSPATK
ncbi:putative UAA transporter family [Trypanosoma vivax]|uniref:UDP-galactose transporter n=1 Tax=Trypanosoma vivax (strain Y486) TaxID=1055687 RepID=G0TYB3_TRYVY|nr:hypothetical protein TRVL_00187 [Trypanosoma vivax]KAH8619730.1 putative UAA transporter family [Trypanosoma vivax]CCC48958.1 conserved hypothetical protein [Trypanosoma vivax Y486]